MNIEIAEYLSKILDIPIEKWGTIREALEYYIKEYSDLIIEEFMDLNDDNELENLYGYVLKKAKGKVITVNIPDDIITLINIMKLKVDLTTPQASSLIIEIVRSFIRTSGVNAEVPPTASVGVREQRVPDDKNADK